MEAIHDQRRLSSLRRVPPRGTGFAAAIAAGLADAADAADPSVRYFVRFEGPPARVVEIATAEDWRELERQIFGEERPGVEVWAQSPYDAILIFPPDRSELPDIALDLLALKMDRAVPVDLAADASETIPAELWTDQKLIADAYPSPADASALPAEPTPSLPSPSMADLEDLYRERMGQDALSPVSPDGPTTRAA